MNILFSFPFLFFLKHIKIKKRNLKKLFSYRQQEEIWNNQISDHIITFLNRTITMGRNKRQAHHGRNHFWENGIVPYRFGSKLCTNQYNFTF